MVHQIFQHFPDFGISEMKDAKQNDGYGLAEDAGTNKFKIAMSLYIFLNESSSAYWYIWFPSPFVILTTII